MSISQCKKKKHVVSVETKRLQPELRKNTLLPKQTSEKSRKAGKFVKAGRQVMTPGAKSEK